MENITENAYFFVWLKAVITGIGTGFTIAFGWLGWMLLAWVACMVLDYITGSVAAAKAGEWSSAAAREGIFHKAGMMVVVIIAAIADGVLGIVLIHMPSLNITYTTALLPVVLIWYIFTELGSITENASAMGAPIPSVLTNILATAATKVSDLTDAANDT